jgi:hypothetical protein
MNFHLGNRSTKRLDWIMTGASFIPSLMKFRRKGIVKYLPYALGIGSMLLSIYGSRKADVASSVMNNVIAFTPMLFGFRRRFMFAPFLNRVMQLIKRK